MFQVERERIREEGKPYYWSCRIKLFDDLEGNSPFDLDKTPKTVYITYSEAYIVSTDTGKTIERIN